MKRVLLGFLFVAAPALAEAQRCTKGIPCGNTCIAANKTCRVGSGTATSAGTRDTARPRPATPNLAIPAMALSPAAAAGDFDPFRHANLHIGDSVATLQGFGMRCTEADAVRYQSCWRPVFAIAATPVDLYYGVLDGRAFRLRMGFPRSSYDAIVRALSVKIGTPLAGADSVAEWPFPLGTLIVRRVDPANTTRSEAVLQKK